MSPDQILALKKQGASNDAIIAQQAMDIANEQGVDMGAAMQEARRNIQALDAAVIAGDTAQEEAGLGSPTRPITDLSIGSFYRPSVELEKRLQKEMPTVLPATPVRSPLDPLAKESAAARAALPPLAGLQQDSLATQALMDMPTGMSPAQRYAMRFGDTGAYDITGGDLRNIDTAARSALNDLSLSNFRQIEGGLNDTSISDTPSYQRLRDLGFTDAQAIKAGSPLQTVLQRPDLNLDIDAAMEATGGVPSAKPKPMATALPSESQPFGGGARNTAEYTDTLNMKMQNDRVNNQIALYEDAIENTQGNVQWQLNQMKSFKLNQPEGFNLLTDAQQLKAAQDEANKFKANASSAIDEFEDSIANNPTNNEILNGQLAKNKVDRLIKAYRDYGIPLGELEDFEGQSVTNYINNKTDLKTVDKITNKANTNAFKGFADSNISESFQNQITQIETDTVKEQKKSADQIIIDNAKTAKDIADAKATTDPTPANTAAANKANDAYNSAVTTSGAMTTTPATTTPATTTTTTPAATGAMGAGLGGAFNEFVDPRSRADIISDIEATPYGRGYQQVLAQLSSNLPVTALTPQYESYLQRNVLPQMQTAFEAGGAGMAGTPTAGVEGSPFSAFEQFVRGGGGRLSSQGYQDLIGNVNTALQAQAPTDRQAYLQSLYSTPESQRDLYAQGLRAGASGAVGDVIDRMVNRRYLQQQFQSPTTAFLPTAMTQRSAYQTPSAIVGSGMVEDTDPFFDYRETTANPMGAGTGGFGAL